MSVIFQLQAKDVVVRVGEYSALNCLQDFSWDSNFNAEQLSQLGDANYDAQTIVPDVSAQFSSRATGSMASFLNRMIIEFNAGTGEFEGYSRGTANTDVIVETDLERAICDLIESKKANEVFTRSSLISRAHLSQFAMSANVDGAATDTFQFEGDLLEIFRGAKRDLISIPVTRKVGAETTTVLLPIAYDVELAGTVATAEWKVYALDIDGTRVMAADLVLTTDDALGDELALSAGKIAAGVTIPLGARTVVYAYKKTPGAFPTITYPTTARFVKADQIDLWLVDPTATFTANAQTITVAAHLAAGTDLNTIPFTQTDKLIRVQSFDITVPLARTALKEIQLNDRGNPVYYRAATFPLKITAQMSMFETDMAEWQKMTKKNSTDVLDLASFENVEWVLVRRDYKKGVALQTVCLLNATVENPGTKVAVNDRAVMQYSFTGSKIALQGV